MIIMEHWIQIIGYGGSFLIALSLSMKSISRLRKINLIGASTFAFYGFLMGAYPVLILNSFISIEEGETLRICLDYSIPAYRDRQNAHYLYHRGQDFFKNLNYRFLVTCSDIPAHQKYLQKIGFQKDTTQGKNWFKKEL